MKNIGIFSYLVWFAFALASCGGSNTPNTTGEPNPHSVDSTAEVKEQVVNLYTHRHYDTDKELFKQFEAETGIKVNVVKAKADELIHRLEREGKGSPADLLVTVDAGRLFRAKEKDLLQAVTSEKLTANISKNFRDKENFWYGLTYRARVLIYDSARSKAANFSTYEALTEEAWKGKVLTRASSNIYNQSLLAGIIAHKGKEGAKAWAQGIVNNMARDPKGNDRDQIKGVVGNVGDVAIANTYYVGKLLNSQDEDEVEVGKKVKVFFPNQETTGTHINVSGAGVTKYSPNKENAIKLLEFLSSKAVQETFASSNYEYPTNPQAEMSDLLKSWGDFKVDTLDLDLLGKHNTEAIMIFNEVNWK